MQRKEEKCFASSSLRSCDASLNLSIGEKKENVILYSIQPVSQLMMKEPHLSLYRYSHSTNISINLTILTIPSIFPSVEMEEPRNANISIRLTTKDDQVNKKFVL